MDAVKTGALIAQARKDRELTQKELAERLHVSAQAVSKWERGLSCPDIGSLEPLAEELGLTVTELLSGQRGEEPKEELVRDSLRFGQKQLGPKIRRWKWLFLLAVLLLLAVLAGMGYVWVRDNTEWLPQRETVVREIKTSEREHQIANALSNPGGSVHLYELTLADDLRECSVQAELWTHDGLEQTWTLLETSAEVQWDYNERLEHNWGAHLERRAEGRTAFGPRQQLLVLSMAPHFEGWSDEELRWTETWFDFALGFASCSTQRTIDGLSDPHINGGVVWRSMTESQTVDRDEGTVLLTLAIGGPNGGIYPPSVLPPEHEGDVQLVIRLYCK